MFLVCTHLHQPDGWLSPGVLEIDEHGFIREVHSVLPEHAVAPVPVDGFVIPGMANVHSHAFQRAMAGLTENACTDQVDTFWSWRSRMYALALELEPDDLANIARQLYVEMLEVGMTAVGEFHYLHHAKDGSPFDVPSEMSDRIREAAADAGIALTHLPVFYTRGGFDRTALPEQRRFTHASLDAFFSLVADLQRSIDAHSMFRVGFAAHSLRAVSPDDLDRFIAIATALDVRAPIHIHIAEQENEVDEAVEHLGARPVEWLLDHTDVDDRWCLIHATHLSERECARLAASGTVVGLCPTTEANLGDGVFPARAFVAASGRFGIGSDSHASVSATEELRTLEYGQRLIHRQRNLVVCGEANATVHTGRFLFDRAAIDGAHALAQPCGALVAGRRADLVVLDPSHPRLAGHGTDSVLDAWIFGGADRAIDRVMVAGRWVVEGGRHLARDAVAARWADTIRRVFASARL